MRFPHAVTIVRPATSDSRYGGTEEDWAAASRTPGYAWVQQRSASEDNANRSATLTTWVAFMPSGTDIAHGDRIEWRGPAMHVSGEPNLLHNPSGPHHWEVPLDLVEG